MSTVENIQLNFNASTGGIDTAISKLNGLGSKISGIGAGVAGLGASLTASISAPLAGLATFGIKSNMTMQDLQTSFKVMLGSEKEAVDLTKKLNDMGAATPFESTQLAEYTKKLINFGFSTKEALPLMSRLGDVSLGDAQKMETLTDSMAKCKGATVLQGEEANRLIDSGFNPLMEISKKTGESMLDVKKRMSAGKVTYAEVEAALVSVTDKGGKFYKGMDEGSKTMSGQLSTLKDNFGALAREFTKPVFDKLQAILPKVITFVSGLATKFQALSSPVKTAILAVAGIAAAIGPILVVAGGLTMAIGGIVSAVGTISTALAAVSAPALGTVAAIAAVVAAVVAIGAVIGYVLAKTGALAGIFDILKSAFNTAKPIVMDLAMNAFGKLKDIFNLVKTALDQVSAVAKPFIEATLKAAKPIINEIVIAFGDLAKTMLDKVGQGIAVLKVIWDTVWPTLVPVLTVVFSVIKTTVITALNVVKDVIKLVTAVINGDWGKVWEQIKNIGITIWNGIKTNAGVIFGAIGKVIGDKVQSAKNTLSGILDGIKGKFSSAFNGIKDIVDKVMGGIAKVINSIGDKINWVKNKAGSLSGASSWIPGFAGGTNYAPGGLALVGEQGPELVNLPRGSQVLNANQTQSVFSGSSKRDIMLGGNITVTLAGPRGSWDMSRNNVEKIVAEAIINNFNNY